MAGTGGVAVGSADFAVITAGVIASATALSAGIMSGIDNVTALIAGIV